MYRMSDDCAFFVCMMGFIIACLRGEPFAVCYYRGASGCQKAMISEGYSVIGKSGSPLSLTQKPKWAWFSCRSSIKSCLLEDEGRLHTPCIRTHMNTQHTIHRSQMPGNITGEMRK